MSSHLPRRTFLTLSAASLAGLVAGCSITPRPPLTYDLAPLRSAGPVSRRTNRMLVLAEPRTIQTYDTDRVVVREAGGVLSYLPQAQWSDRLPRLIQTRLLQSFQDNQFPNVGVPSDQLNARVALILDIRAFELDASTSEAAVTLSGRLIDDVNRTIIATRAFSARTPASSFDAPAVIAALDVALQDVSGQIMAWAAANA